MKNMVKSIVADNSNQLVSLIEASKIKRDQFIQIVSSNDQLILFYDDGRK